MNEIEFLTDVAEFTDCPAAELHLNDEIAAVGLDSIGIFEFLMKIEPVVGPNADIDAGVRTLHDLFDAVNAAAEHAGQPA